MKILYHQDILQKKYIPFIAQTIPIYWGDPLVSERYNTESFINCHAYKDFNAVLERVKEIDSNDDLWFEIINKPKFTKSFEERKAQGRQQTIKFLRNIFTPSLSQAKQSPKGLQKNFSINNYQINIGKELEIIKNNWWYKFGQLSKLQK